MITGEWWITGRREYSHADGDTGDNNHDSAASAYAQVLLEDALSGSSNEALQAIASGLMGHCYDGDVTWMRSDILDVTDDMARNGYPDLYDDPFDYMVQSGIDETLIRLATDAEYDSRELAQKLWGWTAVRRDRLDTYGLSRKKLRDIGETLEDIADEEGHELLPFEEFTLEDFKTGRRYVVTLETLCRGDMEAMFRKVAHIIQ